MITLQQIKEAVEEVYGIKINDKSRTNYSAEARSMFYSIAKDQKCHTYSNMASYVKRTHASAIHGYNLYLNEFRHSKAFMEKRKYIMSKLPVFTIAEMQDQNLKPHVVEIAKNLNKITNLQLDEISEIIDIKIKSWNYANNS